MADSGGNHFHQQRTGRRPTPCGTVRCDKRTYEIKPGDNWLAASYFATQVH